MALFCRNCGAKVSDGWKFCSHCGEKLNNEGIFEPKRSGMDLAADAALERLRGETRSGHLLLKATEDNLGAHLFDSVHSTTWFIFDDGSYAEIEERAAGEYPKDFSERYNILSKDKMAEIKSLIAADWGRTYREAWDGTGWQFDAFHPDGSLLKTSGCGYIYGNLCLEKLASCMPRLILPSLKELQKFEAAYASSENNKQQLQQSTVCGCFYCQKIYKPVEITDWIADDGQAATSTAVCPYCGKDSVIGESSEYSITEDFLRGMNSLFF